MAAAQKRPLRAPERYLLGGGVCGFVLLGDVTFVFVDRRIRIRVRRRRVLSLVEFVLLPAVEGLIDRSASPVMPLFRRRVRAARVVLCRLLVSTCVCVDGL